MSTHWYWLCFAFVTVYGACVGSFLNVVVYRIPEGVSLWRTRSRCPQCGHQIRWFENVPILAWLVLRGRCRKCKTSISVQYMLVELFCAALFAFMYWCYYGTTFRPDFSALGVQGSWPALLVHLILVAALLAATIIDARYYIIPLNVPWFATAFALIVLPIAAIWMTSMEQLAPLAMAPWVHASLGALAGLIIANVLLWLGVLPRSFDDLEELEEKRQAELAAQAAANPENPAAQPQPETDPGAQLLEIHDWLAYPHPRREMFKELLYLALPIVGGIAGYLWPVQPVALNHLHYPLAVHVLGGILLGYFVGAGMIWGTRIFGTLLFGKEAMGLGDVHLLAAVGAVIGARDTAIAFLIAPFLGLLYAAIEFGASSLLKVRHRPIPYGPHLAIASLIVMVFHRPVIDFLKTVFGW